MIIHMRGCEIVSSVMKIISIVITKPTVKKTGTDLKKNEGCGKCVGASEANNIRFLVVLFACLRVGVQTEGGS